MATSGTSSFTLDIIELIEEAYEQAGLEARSGYDIKTARRSLNLLALEWANRGYNLWTVEQGTILLTSGVAVYDLPADTIDVIEGLIRTTSGTTNTDIVISRVGLNSYATLPNKSATGRPVQFWVDRQKTPRIFFWPVPNADTYTFLSWRMKRIQDAGNSGELEFDIPSRFLPCLITGLAYKIGLKRPEAVDRLDRLKAEYEEAWTNAAAEDRERISMRLVPARMGY
jgi:hypothetical protein